MAQDQDHNSILRRLQRLYTRLVLQILHQRMQSYRKSHHARPDQEISTVLYDYIDKAPAPVTETSPESRAPLAQTHAQTTAPHSSSPIQTDEPPSIMTMTRDGLALLFQKMSTGPTIDPAMNDKLKKSAWDHIHAVHRFTRQGDRTSARLHANIANNALKEAAHFMSEDDYAVFIKEIKHVLQDFEH